MYLGRAKEKINKLKKETKELGWDLHLWEGAVKEEKFPHTMKPPHWWEREVGSFGASEERAATVVWRESGENPAQRIGANQHSPA